MELTMCPLKFGLFSLLVIGSVWSKGFEYEPSALTWEAAERACADQNKIMVPGRKYRYRALELAMSEGEYAWLYGWRSVSDITPDADDKLKSLKVDFSRPRKNPSAVACFNGSTYTMIENSARSVAEGRNACEAAGTKLVDITTEDEVLNLTNAMGADDPHWANSISSEASKIKQCLYGRKEGSELHYEFGDCSHVFKYFCIGGKDDFSPLISLKIARFDEFKEVIDKYINSQLPSSSVFQSSTPMVLETTSTPLNITPSSSLPDAVITTTPCVDMTTTSSIASSSLSTETSSSASMNTTSSVAMNTTSSVAMKTSPSLSTEAPSTVAIIEASEIDKVDDIKNISTTTPFAVTGTTSSFTSSSLSTETSSSVEMNTSSSVVMETSPPLSTEASSTDKVDDIKNISTTTPFAVTGTTSSVTSSSVDMIIATESYNATGTSPTLPMESTPSLPLETSSKELFVTKTERMDSIHVQDFSELAETLSQTISTSLIRPSKTLSQYSETTSDTVEEEATSSKKMSLLSSATISIPVLFTDIPVSAGPSSTSSSSHLPYYSIKNQTMSPSELLPSEKDTDTVTIKIQPSTLPNLDPLPSYEIMSTSTSSASISDFFYSRSVGPGYYDTGATIVPSVVIKKSTTPVIHSYSIRYYYDMSEVLDLAPDLTTATPTSTLTAPVSTSSVLIIDPVIQPSPTYSLETSMLPHYKSSYVPDSATEMSSKITTGIQDIDEFSKDFTESWFTPSNTIDADTVFNTLTDIDDIYSVIEPTSTQQVIASTAYYTTVPTPDIDIEDDDTYMSKATTESVDKEIDGDVDVKQYDEDNVSAIESQDVPKNEEGIEIGVWVAFGILIALVIVSLVLAFVLYRRRKQQKAKFDEPNSVAATPGAASNTIELRDSRSPSRENGKSNGPQSV
ncbi:hypothetical protein ACF0H5_012452 [Mactra antiquata]